MDPKLSLSWDAHQKSICNGLSLLQQRGEFVDMTLAADGHHVKVHQMVMSLVSPYIKELITSAQCPHPVIFLNKVSYHTLQLLLEYAYTGEVMMPREELHDFLEACRVLHVKGLQDESIKATAEHAVLHHIGNDNNNTEVKHSNTILQTELTGQKPGQFEHIENQNIDHSDTVMEFTYTDESHISAAEDPLDKLELEALEPSEQAAGAGGGAGPAGTTVQYTLSCMGSIQIILNRYLYRLRYSRKNDRKMWRCADYNKKKCPAYVITKGDLVLERGCAHSHPFHDRQILKRLRAGNLYAHFTAAAHCAGAGARHHAATDSAGE